MSSAGSRREENRIARRAAIVAIARRRFLEHGYAATSMSTIAGTLGGSKGTLWAYFPSKEALFDAVLDDVTAAFRAQLDDALRPGRDCRTTLIDFAERFLGKMLNPDAMRLHRLVIGEGGRFPEVGRLFYDRGPARVLRHLSTFIGERMAIGQLRDADPFRAAQHLIQLIQVQQNLRLWGVASVSCPEEVSRFPAEAVDVFHRAYGGDDAAALPEYPRSNCPDP